MNIVKTTITPLKAKEMLDSSKGNRSLRRERVKEHTAAMLAGDWKLNGETIKVYEDGTLQDGHHRLTAVVESGVTIEAIIFYGLTKEAAITVDKGSARTAADNILFSMPSLGVEVSGIASAMIGCVLMHDDRRNWVVTGGGSRHVVTDKKRIEFLQLNTCSVIDSVEFSKSAVKRGNAMMSKSSVAALHFLGSRISKIDTEEFLNIVFLGYGVEPNTTADNLRNWLIKSQNMTRKPTPGAKLATAAKCLNSFLKGRNIKHECNIRVRQDESAIFFI